MLFHKIPSCWTSYVNVELQVAEFVNLIQKKTHDGERSVTSKTKRSMHARLGCKAYNPAHKNKPRPLPQISPCWTFLDNETIHVRVGGSTWGRLEVFGNMHGRLCLGARLSTVDEGLFTGNDSKDGECILTLALPSFKSSWREGTAKNTMNCNAVHDLPAAMCLVAAAVD